MTDEEDDVRNVLAALDSVVQDDAASYADAINSLIGYFVNRNIDHYRKTTQLQVFCSQLEELDTIRHPDWLATALKKRRQGGVADHDFRKVQIGTAAAAAAVLNEKYADRRAFDRAEAALKESGMQRVPRLEGWIKNAKKNPRDTQIYSLQKQCIENYAAFGQTPRENAEFLIEQIRLGRDPVVLRLGDIRPD